MAENQLREIIESGDTERLLSVALNAAFSDDRCECDAPITHGLDLMCGRCLRENDAQYEKRTNAMNSSHPFRPHGEDPVSKRMCGFCSRWDDDPLHAPGPVPPSTEQEARDGA